MLNTEARILIVDDMASICEQLREMLSVLGYMFVSVASDTKGAKEMITAASTENKPFHLVLSDINMPGESGLDLLKWLRSTPSTRATPLILVSSSGDIDNVMKGVELGTTAFIVKPVLLETLKAKLAKL